MRQKAANLAPHDIPNDEPTVQAASMDAAQKPLIPAAPFIKKLEVDGNKHGSFSAMLKLFRLNHEPDLFDVRIVRPEAQQAVQPKQLQRKLFGSYQGERAFNGRLLTATEISALTFSANNYAQRIVNQVGSRSMVSNPERLAHKKQEVTQKALGGRRERAENMLTVLDGDNQALKDLQTEIENPGRSHGSPFVMAETMARAQGIFEEMVRAVAVNEQQDEQEYVNALTNFLVGNSYDEAIGNWKAMTGLAIQWTTQKQGIFNKKVREIQQYLRERVSA